MYLQALTLAINSMANALAFIKDHMVLEYLPRQLSNIIESKSWQNLKAHENTKQETTQ